MKARAKKIYQAAKKMILSGKNLNEKGVPGLSALRDISGIKDASFKERNQSAQAVREEMAIKPDVKTEVAGQPAQTGKTSYQIVIPNMRPINHRRLMGRFKNVFDKEPISHGDGHIQIDFTKTDPEEVKTTILAVLSGWGYTNPEALVR